MLEYPGPVVVSIGVCFASASYSKARNGSSTHTHKHLKLPKTCAHVVSIPFSVGKILTVAEMVPEIGLPPVIIFHNKHHPATGISPWLGNPHGSLHSMILGLGFYGDLPFIPPFYPRQDQFCTGEAIHLAASRGHQNLVRRPTIFGRRTIHSPSILG